MGQDFKGKNPKGYGADWKILYGWGSVLAVDGAHIYKSLSAI